MHSLPVVIMGIYNPPPATMKVLKEAIIFMSEYPDAHVICMGDFNMWLNPKLDRFGKNIQRGMVGSKSLERFTSEVGWFDLWRIRNPDTRTYSWHAPGRGCMSRINLAMGNEKMLLMVQSVKYMSRGVSDHSGLVFELKIGSRGSSPGYRIQSHWLTQIGPNDRISDQMVMFWKPMGREKWKGRSGIPLRRV